MSRSSRGGSGSGEPLLSPVDHPTGKRASVNDASYGADDAPLVDADGKKDKQEAKKDDSKALIISFLAMVVVGLGNKIFQPLEFIPMYNYPLFINLLTTLVYIPASFAYILPMAKWGTLITKEALAVPKYKFFVMGTLDSIAGVMQSLAVAYIQNGALVILLSQAAIPASMAITKCFLTVKYKISQYVGAIVVAVGLVVVLLPSFEHPSSTGNNAVLWSAIMVLSCVPMCLSSVYKEKALGETEIDAVYLNGWVAVFQFLVSFPLLIPTAPAAHVPFGDLPMNIWNGTRCLVGENSITNVTMTPYQREHGAHIDDCSEAPLFVWVYIVFNVGYNVLIILILKYGSSNILWMAMTVMVPLGNLTFALDFVPGHHPLKPTDIIGLIVIMSGLITYRFFSSFRKAMAKKFPSAKDDSPDDVEAVESMLSTPTRGTTLHTTHGHKDRKHRHSQEFTAEQYKAMYGRDLNETPQMPKRKGRGRQGSGGV